CLQCVLFFLFQAEDGIRDWSVTGVQPCALPISSSGAPRRRTMSGMVMMALDIVRRLGAPDEATIREELKGNICRCTGYHNIVKAIAAGARAMTAEGK